MSARRVSAHSGFTMIEIALLVALVVLIVLGIYAAVEEGKQWRAFKEAHHCKLVEHIRATSSTGVGIGPDGKVGTVIVTTPAKSAFLCDDGVTYWR